MSMQARLYVQCRLQRGQTRQIAWIPEKFAVAGQVVRLKDNAVWEDGWQVGSVGARASEAYVLLHSHDTGDMRRATDI